MAPTKEDWERLEHDVVGRIRLLRAITESPEFETDPNLHKVYNDLILPNVRLLAEFICCVNVATDPPKWVSTENVS